MYKLRRIALLLILASLCAATAPGQDLPSSDQILANLRFRIPDLRDAELELDSITESSFEGFHQGTVLINGEQQLPFLLSVAYARVLLLLSHQAIDVSLSIEQVAERQEQERQLEAISEAERHDALMEYAEGMASRGPADAPVTIFEFSDFQCPYCARGFATIEELLKQYPDEVRFVYLHKPLPIHNWAKPAAIAAVCAEKQSAEAFWMLHDNYFRNQSEIALEGLVALSRSYLMDSGIDLDAWHECAANATSADYLAAAAAVESSIDLAESAFGVTGTPGFFINGRFLNGAHPIETFVILVEEFLRSPDSQ